MKKQEQSISFEEALKGLEEAAGALKKEDTTLEDAIKHYEKGVFYYQRCAELLESAKQKIQIFDQSQEILEDF